MPSFIFLCYNLKAGDASLALHSQVERAILQSGSSVYMTNKQVKKIQFGGYNKKRYKEIRKFLKVIEEKELEIKLN